MDIILQDLDPRETYLKWFSNNTTSRPNGRELAEIPIINFKSGTFMRVLAFFSFLNYQESCPPQKAASWSTMATLL